MMHTPLMRNYKRSCEIVKEATDLNHFWEAYDQGRYAYACGYNLTHNPFPSYHTYSRDWDRGWIFEQEYAAEEREYIEALDIPR